MADIESDSPRYRVLESALAFKSLWVVLDEDLADVVKTSAPRPRAQSRKHASTQARKHASTQRQPDSVDVFNTGARAGARGSRRDA